MDVTLTPKLEALIDEKVRSGRYLDASDVVRDALRTLFAVEGPFESPELEALIADGIDGPYEPLSELTLDSLRQEALVAG